MSSFVILSKGECPDPLIVKPCTCDEPSSSISCNPSSIDDYKAFFEKISDSIQNKKFKKFFLTHGNFQQFPSNMFAEVKFEEVEFWLSDMSNIRIDSNAFKSLDGTLKHLYLEECKLSQNGGLEVIKEIKHLPHLQTIWLPYNHMTTLPSNLFEDIECKQMQLKWLIFQQNQITKVETRAVFGLNNLQILNLEDNPIQKIEKFAFATEESNHDLLIYFFGNLGAHSSAFGPLSLAGIRRPAYLLMGSPNFKTLNEASFTLYFEQHSQHYIYWENVYGNLTCNCEALWLWDKKEQYRSRFKDKYTGKESAVSCENYQNKLLWDLNREDFGNCD